MNEVKKPKKPLLYYYLVVMLILMLFNFLALPWMSQYRIQDVDYNWLAFRSPIYKRLGKLSDRYGFTEVEANRAARYMRK